MPDAILSPQHDPKVSKHLALIDDIAAEALRQMAGVNDWEAPIPSETLNEVLAIASTLIASSIPELRKNAHDYRSTLKDVTFFDDQNNQLMRFQIHFQKLVNAIEGLDSIAGQVGYPDASGRVGKIQSSDIDKAPIKSDLSIIHSQLDDIQSELKGLKGNAHTGGLTQMGLINVFTGDVSLKVKLGKLLINLGETIDLNALGKIVRDIGRLTKSFYTTVTAAASRATKIIRECAERLKAGATKTISSVKTLVGKVLKRRSKPAQPSGSELEPDEAIIQSWEAEAHEQILRGESVPDERRAFIRRLSFFRTNLVDLSPVSDLTNLVRLDLSNTEVSDLSPLNALTNLSRLDLIGTKVSDLSPLNALTKLSWLDLKRTQVRDLSPLNDLTNLSRLYLSNTQVSDLSPLSALTNLSELALTYTQARDLAPLNALTNLLILDLRNTQVTDLSPLKTLTKLSILILRGTQVAELSPLKALINLSMLNLSGTQVNDFSPLNALTNLSELFLSDTSIRDLSPLKALTNLSLLHLSFTPVSDISPLNALTYLSALYLIGTQVSDTSVLKQPGLKIYGP